jgi:CBS domain-containing protein
VEFLEVRRLNKQIAHTGSLEELMKLRNQLHEMFHKHLSFACIDVFYNLMNDMHDELILRAIQLAEIETEQRTGTKPDQYAFMLLGSGGRREQTLWSDQDNAMVYELRSEHDVFLYKTLSDIIHHNLILIGYPPCDGNVLSSNQSWRGDIAYWTSLIESCFQQPDWEHMRYILIFSDARCISGNAAYVDQLKNHMFAYVQEHPEHLSHLLQNTLHRKVAKGILGQLIREQYGEDGGGIDIKYGVYIPFVNGCRLLAIQHGITCTSSVQRIQELERKLMITAVEARQWIQAMTQVLFLRAMTVHHVEHGLYSSKGILPSMWLTKDRKKEIKQCIRIAQQLEKRAKASIRY